MVYTDIHLPLSGFIALDWSLMTLALIPILLRLSLRYRTRIPNTLASSTADAFLVLAWLSGCVLICINTWKNHLRMSYLHADPSTLYYGVPRPLSGHLLYVSWISLFFIYISLWASKAAFLAFYYSIFSLQGTRARFTLAVACAFTAATFLIHMFLIAFWCSPVSSNWSPPPGEHLCSAVHSMSSVTISTFTNIATDLVILFIPISSLLATHLGKTERAGLVFVFVMGSVSIVAALVRFVTLKLVQKVPRAEITHTIDVWALVEIVSSILAVCAPSLRTFVRRHTKGGARAQRLGSASASAGSRSSRGSGSLCRAESVPSWDGRDGLEKEEVEVGVEEACFVRMPEQAKTSSRYGWF
ncbi:hypothetical protein EJ04DRAFT_492587 [Polyplosphaeria fusca]|uniref:Rhodopsin domain-containing protein n=1 Tax=Polyplosphaeria fusca TaxID=682080 RepID=A0A9P4QY75_9PLEO|nr:hypothetical protein EJ04DRAFT_492587 [Polyplosphaeria fusca]